MATRTSKAEVRAIAKIPTRIVDFMVARLIGLERELSSKIKLEDRQDLLVALGLVKAKKDKGKISAKLVESLS